MGFAVRVRSDKKRKKQKKQRAKKSKKKKDKKKKKKGPVSHPRVLLKDGVVAV